MSNIIFDFDGTLADSLPVVMKLFYEWSKIEPFSPEEVERLRDMSLRQVLREVGIPLWRVPRLMVTARARFGKRLGEVPVFDGIPEVIKQFHGEGHKLYVISSNSPTNIHSFLKRNDIDHYFSGIHGNTGLFGKAPAIRQLMRKHKLVPGECIYIGDETRDVDAARKARITCAAVSWGYNGEKVLRQHHPDHFVTHPAELLKLLQ